MDVLKYLGLTLFVVVSVTTNALKSEDVAEEIKNLEKEKSEGDPFGIITLANRVGRAAFHHDYSMENDKNPSPEHQDSLKRKESDWKKDEEMEKTVAIDKTVRRKEHSQGETRARSSSSARDSFYGDRRMQDAREDQRNYGRRVENNRRKSIDEDRRNSDEYQSYTSDRRSYYDDSRIKSNSNRRDRNGSNQSRGSKRRRRPSNNNNNHNNSRNEGRPGAGRMIHRIVVTNKVICPNCTHTSSPQTQSTPTNPHYYY